MKIKFYIGDTELEAELNPDQMGDILSQSLLLYLGIGAELDADDLSEDTMSHYDNLGEALAAYGLIDEPVLLEEFEFVDDDE